MAMRLNARELQEVLQLTPASHNLLLVGKHGLGKSQILTRYFAQQGLKVVSLFLGQMSDPGDLIGLPEKNPVTGRTEFVPPYWWPQGGEPVVLFLDELNRARPELLQSVQDLTLNRVLAGRTLPKGSRVVAAVNAGDEYQLTDLDPALLSRFNVYEFVPERDEWLAWAASAMLDKRVIQFIEKNCAYLETPPQDVGQDDFEKTPDRRAWERVSQVVQPHASLSPTLVKLIAGIVGVQAALAFRRFVESNQGLTADTIMAGLSDAVRAQLDQLSLPETVQLNRQLAGWIEEKAPKLVAAKRQRALKTLEQYVEHLSNTEKREALADLINLIEKGTFSQASLLLMESPKVFKLIEHYIQGVKL